MHPVFVMHLVEAIVNLHTLATITATLVCCIVVHVWTRRRTLERMALFNCNARFRSRRTNPRPPITIVVDGAIGAGKSSLLTVLREHGLRNDWSVCFIEEPVGMWVKVGILGKFYSNIKKWAYRFQTFVFVTRVEAMQVAVESNPNADVYILERSIFTDRFMFVELLLTAGNMQPVERDMYLEWWHCWRHAVPLWPRGFIYLDVPSAECNNRWRKRGREGETIPSDYNEQLRLKHEEFFQQMESRRVPVLRLTPTKAGNYVDNADDARRVCSLISIFAASLPKDESATFIDDALLSLR